LFETATVNSGNNREVSFIQGIRMAQQPDFEKIRKAYLDLSRENALMENLTQLNVNDQVAEIQQRLTQTQNTLGQLTYQVNTLPLKIYNRGLPWDMPIRKVPDFNGNIPENCPETKDGITSMSDQELDALLNAYGIQPPPTREAKCSSLSEFLACE
jgi:hypothetical protein